MKIARELSTQVLVIGGGAAGCRAALAAAEEGSKAILTNKGPLARSGITLTAGGGLEAPFHPDDSPEQYFEDVVHHGYFLGDQNLAWALAEEACQRVRDLERYGCRFNRKPDGSYDLNKFPGFTYPRNVVFPGGGFGMMDPLKKSCLANPNITVLEDFMVTGLLMGGQGDERACAGALGLDLKTGWATLIRADATVMATGGCQWIWKVNDCPADATGDGVAMAYRVGAEIVDMEMILFYPSVIVWPPAAQGAFVHYEVLDPSFLDGEILDRNGKSVLPKPTPVRDKAMLMMLDAIDEGRGTDRGGLWWYVGNSPRPDLVKMFTSRAQYNYIRRQGIEPATDKIEVAPGAHYQLGGILIDEICRTTVPGLFAAPECAGNYEGANRLSGTALAGTQVFGARAGTSAHQWSTAGRGTCPTHESVEQELGRLARRVRAARPDAAGMQQDPRPANEAAKLVIHLRESLREAAQKHIAVRRRPAGVEEFLGVVAALRRQLDGVRVADVGVFNQPLVDALELESMLSVAELVAGSALVRQESRGHHFRLDFPQQDDANWLRHTSVRLGPDGPRYGTRPVVVTRMPLGAH
jgi:succinate dehydrogenase/fumarate reductase flavoprotein subunit